MIRQRLCRVSVFSARYGPAVVDEGFCYSGSPVCRSSEIPTSGDNAVRDECGPEKRVKVVFIRNCLMRVSMDMRDGR